MSTTGHSVPRALTVRYLFALGLVAALASANFVVLRAEIRANESSAELLTLSGRQRTLLQSTALLAQGLVSIYTPAERAPLRSELLGAIESLETAHHRLVEFDPTGRGGPPPEVQEIYESTPWLLDTEIRNYLTHLRELARGSDDDLTFLNPHYRYIREVALQGEVMDGLDAVVAAYHQQSAARAAQLRAMARWSLTSTLLMLGLTGLFVFRPMVARVRHDMAALQELNDTLEERVAERTEVAEQKARELADSESALRRQTGILQSILDSMGEGVIVVDRERQFLLINPAARQVFQISSDDVPRSWSESERWIEAFGLTPYLPDRRTPYPADSLPLVRALRGEPDARAEAFFQDRLKSRSMWLHIAARPLRDSEGSVQGAVAVLRDVTGHKRAEQELRDSEALYHSLVENLPLGVVRKNLEGRFIYVNEPYCRMTGQTLEGAIGSTDFDLLPREVAEQSLRTDERVLKTGEVFQQLQEQTGPDGRTRLLELLKAPVKDSSGAVIGTQTVLWDVTERKAAEERMLQAERLAAVGEMVTGVAHESRNALQQIGACAKMLEWEVKSDSEASGLIADVLHAHGRLHRLFESLRGYVAPLKIEKRPVNVQEVFEEAWKMVSAQCEGRDVAVRQQPSANGRPEPRCAMDPFHMEQVFRNVLENSLAACGDPVRFSVSWREATLRGKPAVRITIADNGPGLSTEAAQRIFEPFFTTKRQGTGLGMAIVRRIIEAHEGRIDAESCASGAGTEVRITLPKEV